MNFQKIYKLSVQIVSMVLKGKIQLIKRTNSEQYFINFPAQVAQILGLKKGEDFEWSLEDKNTFKLKRKYK